MTPQEFYEEHVTEAGDGIGCDFVEYYEDADEHYYKVYSTGTQYFAVNQFNPTRVIEVFPRLKVTTDWSDVKT